MQAKIVIEKDAIRCCEDLLAQAFSIEFEKIGIQSEIVLYPDAIRNDVLCEYSNMLWFFLLRLEYLGRIRRKPPKGLKFFYNDERLPVCMNDQVLTFDHIDISIPVRQVKFDGHEEKFQFKKRRDMVLAKRAWYDWILDYNPHNRLFWDANGIQSVFLPIGWHEAFRLPKPKERIPGVFGYFKAGTSTYERRNKVMKDLSRRGVTQRTPYNKRAKDRVHMSSYTVGISCANDDNFEVFPDRRMSLYATNQMAIVSERTDWTPFSDEQWKECEYEQLVDSCCAMLHASGQFAESAERFYRERFRFDRHLHGVLNRIL